MRYPRGYGADDPAWATLEALVKPMSQIGQALDHAHQQDHSP
jgi:hypothetical protein